MVWTSFISSRCQSVLKKVFGRVGLYAHTHPCVYLLTGILLTVLSGVGLLNATFESDGQKLYIPQDSEIYKQYERTIDNFGETVTVANLLIGERDGDNLLTPDGLDALYEIYQYTTFNISGETGAGVWDFPTLCERDYPGYPLCETEEIAIFSLWNDNETEWRTQALIDQDIASARGQELASFVMGGVQYNDNGSRITGGSYIRLSWTLKATTNDTIYNAHFKWMLEFAEYWESQVSSYKASDNYRLSYFTSRSIGDEVGRVVQSDAQVYVVAILVMFVYLAFTLGDFTCLGARPWMAGITVLVMLMSLITSYGLGSAMGYHLTSLAFLLPYLLLGVGVDDEIIIVEAVDKSPYLGGDPTEGGARYKSALQHSGLSITLTSFCSVMAFFIGATSSMPGVESFCIFAALGFLANYVLQFLIFLPLLTMDEKRKRARRNFCCCCIKHASPEKPNSTNPDGRDVDEGERFSFGIADILERFVLPLLTNQVSRIVIIIIFFGGLAGSLASLQWLDTTSDLTTLVPDDSYVIDYLSEYGKAFGSSQYSEISIIFENLDFSDQDVRQGITLLLADFNEYEDNTARIIGSVDNWFEPFEEFVNETLGLVMNDLSSDEFYAHLQTFANDTEYAEWDDEIIYDDADDPSEIKATKFYMNFQKPADSKKEWKLRNKLNSLIDDRLGGTESGYVYESNYPFSYYESVVTTLTIWSIVAASVGVLMILLLLMDLRMAIFIILIVVMIDFGLFGWLVLCGLSLDSLAFLQLVMAVGLTVDYVIHIAHAIADAPSPDGLDSKAAYNEKLKIALLDMGVGVTKGAWTTFLGAIPLAFSSSEAFRRFFYLFAGIITVALAHGLFFVPAVMAQMPFVYKGIGHANEEADKNVDNAKGDKEPKEARAEMSPRGKPDEQDGQDMGTFGQGKTDTMQANGKANETGKESKDDKKVELVTVKDTTG